MVRNTQNQLPLDGRDAPPGRPLISPDSAARCPYLQIDILPLLCLLLVAVGWLAPLQVPADTGSWSITQLPFANAQHPSIDNAGEIVWQVQNSTGIVSSVRGQLSPSGVSPHLANGGEVVYADTFGGPFMDLVSTTRGRLTQGSVIQLGFSDFGVNSNGEVVYCALTNGNWQVFSTVRGQMT